MSVNRIFTGLTRITRKQNYNANSFSQLRTQYHRNEERKLATLTSLMKNKHYCLTGVQPTRLHINKSVNSLNGFEKESRCFCTDKSAVTEAEYEELADSVLEALSDKFEDIQESFQCDSEYDVSLGSGVLTVKISSDWGTYVINKQAPNKQIWLSSPIRSARLCHGVAQLSWNRTSLADLHLPYTRSINQVIGYKKPGESFISGCTASGPKRYDYVQGQWIYKHDGQSLQQLLTKEISEAFSANINFSFLEQVGR